MTSGCISMRPTAEPPASRRGIGTACPTSSARIRSRSTRTSGSSRRTTSAGCWSATGRIWPRRSAAAAPSTTAAASRAGRRCRPATSADDHDDDGHGDDEHGDQLNFYKLSFEGTRRWRALKLWMSWQHVGSEGFGRLIEANIDLAAYLARSLRRVRRLRGAPRGPGALGRLLPPSARWPGGGRSAGRPPPSMPTRTGSSARSSVSGDGWLTTTRLRGSTWLRAGIVNYLSTEDDIDRMLETLRRLA